MKTVHRGICLSWLLAGALLAPLARAELPTKAREQLNAVVYSQQAVEFRANALQTYRLATSKLAQAKAQTTVTASVEQSATGGFKNKRAAVVLDIDETTLDNMAFNAMLLRDGRVYDDHFDADWNLWVKERKAGGVPGVKEFISAARGRGFKVVFITNRACNKATGYDAQGNALDCPQKAATQDNLEAVLGYRPGADELLLRGDKKDRDDKDKQARREQVAAKFRIVMLVGDDLNDFIRAANYSPADHERHWGERWFALTNPVYGSWQDAFKSVEQKYAALKPWNLPAAPGGSSGPTNVNVVSWNMEWLADPAVLESSGYWTQCQAQGWPNSKLRDDLPFCDVYKKNGITSAAAYEARKLAALRGRLAELANDQVDVLAVVEVQGKGALEAVLPAGYEVACFTSRIDPQNVGFAVRTAANLPISCREIASLSLEGVAGIDRPVRRGLELTLGTGTRAVTLLNVHLKSSCPTGPMDSAANTNCRTLQAQAQPLEAWIEDQGAAGRNFMIVGDWNRDLEAEAGGGFPARSDGSNPADPIPAAAKVRNLWPEINDKVPATSAMELVTMDRSASDNRACFNNLDQAATSVTLLNALDPASLVGGKQPAAMLTRPREASDHCPVQMKLRLR